MTVETQIKSVALFFSYAFLDDTLALKATKAVVRKLNRISISTQDVQTVIVQLTYQYWNQLKRHQSEDTQFFSSRMEALGSGYNDVSPWREFKRKAEEEEFLSVLWTEVLGIQISKTAKALAITEGTVKHRVNRGLRILAERVT